MKILAIQPNIKTNNTANIHNNVNNPIANAGSYHKTAAPTASLNYFYPSFKGISYEEDIVRQVKGKQYYGDALYDKNNFIDFDKVGWANLSKENFDITSAKSNEIYAFQHALALGETVDTSWVQRFNPFNVDLPLATNHTLCDRNSKVQFAKNLQVLLDTSKHKELDTPIFDKKGNLTLNCIVWDTETTGINTTNPNLPLDRIIQIGSIQLKNGKVDNNTAYKQLINPEMNIPTNASLVHGIYDKDVENQPKMNEVLPQYLKKHLNPKNGYIVAYNSKFDMRMLNNEIDRYNKSDNHIKQKSVYNVIDPFIITQRIHPFVGAKKKLGEQYKYLFCKNLDDAHDAFADVKGTVDVLKYDLYYLNNHRKDKKKPLTVRDVLIFQNGSNQSNINIKLNHLGYNDKVKFNMSYRLKPLNVVNYSMGYSLKEENIPKMEAFIGAKNTQKLQNIIIPPVLAKESDEGIPVDTTTTKSKSKKTVYYTQNRNFKKILKFADIQGYGNASRTEVIDYITQMSKNYINNDSVDLIYKNTNPKDTKYGNDMPDFNISKKVMLEKKNQG